MKPIEQILFDGFHSDPDIEVSDPDRFHFHLDWVHFYPGIEVGNPDWFHFDLDWFHFKPNRPYTARSVGVQNY